MAKKIVDEKQQTTPQTEEKSLTAEISEALQEIVEAPEEETKNSKALPLTLLTDGQFLIEDRPYALVYNYRNGFDEEALAERFSEVLSRYDYIVGDWGYEQLRLKGFFDNENKRATPEQKIATLQDYLYEYCNFGCRFFVIEKMNKKKEKTNRPKRKKKKTPVPAPAFIEEKVQPVKKGKPVIHRQKQKSQPEKASHVTEKNSQFTIRKRED